MATKPELELFYKQDCPWCHKVIDFMEANDITVPLRDIYAVEDGEANLARLMEVGGKRQVPCLFVNGDALYESADIINYLSDLYGVGSDVAADATADIPAGAHCTIDGVCTL